MNVSEAGESDLALRVRRAIAGRARRMSTRSRVLAALLLCGVCAVALPSIGLAGGDDDIDWNVVKTTAPEDWSDELKGRIVAAGYDLQAITERVRLHQEKAATREEDPDGDRLRAFREGVVARAMATAPEDWSDRLKAAIVRAGWDLDEFTEGVRLRQQVVESSDGPGTSVEARSWGQVKAEVANPE